MSRPQAKMKAMLLIWTMITEYCADLQLYYNQLQHVTFFINCLYSKCLQAIISHQVK